MPVTLVVRSVGSSTFSGASSPREANSGGLTFDAPRVVLGRGSSCDVRLPDASVSARHASIRARDGGYVVVDEGSTNGTFCNGERLAPHSPRPLRTGDELRLGRVRLEVRIGAAKTSTPAATEELALALVARALGDAGASPITIEVTAGPDVGRTLVVDPKRDAGKRLTVGRDPRCALRLTDRGIPPIAFDLLVEGTRVLVTTRDGRAPVSIVASSEAHPSPAPRAIAEGASATWPNRGSLVVGATTLLLDDPIAAALDRSAHGDDEKIPNAVSMPAEAPAVEAPPNVIVADPATADVVAARANDAPLIDARSEIHTRRVDRRSSWRGATIAFEIVALVVGLLVLGGSAAGLWWLLRGR